MLAVALSARRPLARGVSLGCIRLHVAPHGRRHLFVALLRRLFVQDEGLREVLLDGCGLPHSEGIASDKGNAGPDGGRRYALRGRSKRAPSTCLPVSYRVAMMNWPVLCPASDAFAAHLRRCVHHASTLSVFASAH